MAEDQPADDPDYLYKYRSIRNEADISKIFSIIDGELFAAGRDQFNDPFDCFPLAKFEGEAGSYIRELSKKYLPGNRADRRKQIAVARARFQKTSPDESVRDAVDAVIDSTGIISLSSRPDSLLMWGHYGSDHTGACLRFRRHRKSRFIEALRVKYSDLRPTVKMPIKDQLELIDSAFLTKASCWSYEEEWRVCERNGKGRWKFDPEDLDGIIFGAKCTEANIGRVKRRVEGSRKNVNLFHAKLAAEEYKIEIEPI